MKLIELLVYLSKYFPNLSIRSRNAEKIKRIYPTMAVGKFISASLVFALVLAAIVFLLGFSLPLFLLSFSFFFYIFISTPSFELKKENVMVESELPFFIRELGILLDLGVPFKNALATAGKANVKLNGKITALLSEVEAGSYIQKALSSLAHSSDSSQLKRASSVLISAYESGSSSGLIPFSDELLLLQHHKLKDSSSRLALFGIVFIVFSALGPTFFLIYFTLGSAIFDTVISEPLFLLVMLVVFPFISLLILLLSGQFNSSEPMAFELNPIKFFQSQKKQEEIALVIPDALISIATLPAGASAESAFNSIAKGGYGQLSEEFSISLKQLRSKISLDRVLQDLSKRNNSPQLTRATILLSHVFSTNNFPAAARLAEDFLAELDLRRERENIFSIHKYTLFFGALLIPLILSIAISLSSSLSLLLAANQNSQLISAIVQLYLVIYCVLVSYFVASVEGKKSLLVIYFSLLLALALITFHTLNLIQQ